MKPILQAMIVADHVYQDAKTGKHIVAGIFNQIFFMTKDAVDAQLNGASAGSGNRVLGGAHVGSTYVYLNLVDMKGTNQFKIQFVGLKDNEVYFDAKFELRSEDPIKTCEASFGLPQLPTHKAGDYALELIWIDSEQREELIGSVRIKVTQMTPSQE